MEEPGTLGLRALGLVPAGPADVVVRVDRSGVSTGTERLLWEGRMPAFPGMGYPLVPGYESVGVVVDAGADARGRVGDTVFVPGATCFEGARGLFGGAARTVVLPAARAAAVPDGLAHDGVLLALAATAQHAVAGGLPELIVGHGALGRLAARLVVAAGGAPTVWETQAERRGGAAGYAVVDPSEDDRRDYARVLDASGDVGAIDTLIARLARGGELVLAGFYATRPSFDFAPAFMREARLRIAAQWAPGDLDTVLALVASGALSLAGMVTEVADAADARGAYERAFGDPACVKMVLDWSGVQ